MVTLVSHHPACFPELKRKEKEKKSKLLKHKSFSPSFNFHDETHVKRFDYGEQGCDYQTLKVSPVPESFLLLQNTVECFHHPALSCWRVTGLRVQEERGAPSTAESSSVLSSLTTLLSCSFGKITVRSRVLPGHSSLDSPDSAVSFKTFWDLQHFRPRGSCPPAQSWAVVLPPVVLLPGVDQLFSEPAGQWLTHPVEQLGQLNVVIPVVLPEECLGLKQTKEVNWNDS